MRQKQGTNLCAYYICENIHGLVGPPRENIHGLVGPPRALADWEEEVSKKLINV